MYSLWVYLFMKGEAKMFNNDHWTTVMCKIVLAIVISWGAFILLLAYI